MENYMGLNPAIKIINGYGPTETTICASSYNYQTREPVGEIVPIGIPLANNQIILIDDVDLIVPVGVVGEICISGDGISRGYLNNPELTAEKYNPHPYFKGRRMYRTGDLARLLPDGNLLFVGRKDNQLKIRGYRIEPGEIENRLLKHAEVREAIVLPKEDTGGEKYLAAYFVSDLELSDAELRAHLLSDLPDYMVPTYFAQLEKIPLLPSGKVDRRALPKPRLKISESYTAPRDEIEKKLVKIYAEVLGRDELHASQLHTSLGIDDNFFQLGGHSLKATILAAKIHKVLNIHMPLAEIFKRSTVRELAEFISGKVEEQYEAIHPVEEKEYYELSSAQKRLYFLQQMEPDSLAYNIPVIIYLPEDVHIEKLADVCRELINRHDSLRTSFHMLNEAPVQVVHNKVAFKIENFATDEHGQTRTFLTTGANFFRSFDLSQAPLIRAGLIKEAGKRCILLVDMHHIITDGTSQEILKQDFIILYKGEKLPALRLQYKDFAGWQNSNKERERLKRQESYWLREFSGEIPVLDIPTDYPRPLLQSFAGDRVAFEIPAAETRALNAVALQGGATLFMVLAAVLNILLAKLSGHEDIIIGAPVAGRRHADLQKIIGMFVNTLALRNYPNGEKAFPEFLNELKDRTLAAFENQEYQFEDLVEKVAINRDISRNPLFDVLFVVQNIRRVPGDIFENSTIENEMVPHNNDNIKRESKFDLEINAWEVGPGLKIVFGYCTELFKKETIERFIIYFKKIIAIAAQEPGIRISDIEIISEEEKKRIINEFNDTAADYPKDKTIHQLFAEQVGRTPDRIALVGADLRVCPVNLTYRQLNEQSGRLAGQLIKQGVQPDTIVAIMGERSLETIVGLIAILKSGGAYLPIDPEYPQERIDYMLKDSGAQMMIGNRHTCSKIHCSSFITHHSNQLAYVIYTSGSTGKPKGVMIENRSVINFIKGITDIISFQEGERILSLTTISFDIFGLETILPLTKGSTVIIGSAEEQRDAGLGSRVMIREDITIFQATPSRLQLFIQDLEPGENLKRLKYLLVGGEVFPEALLAKLKQRTGGIIYNVYGPTETTIWSTIKEVGSSNKLNIGKPLANTFIYILSRGGLPLPVGVAGEIRISGAGVARGYINRPELTQEKFTGNPFVKGERQYSTGDIGRWLPDGNIECLGRIDHQVKIKGVRVEPGEIENQLLKHLRIKDTAVLVKEDEAGDKSLSAYFVSDIVLSDTELRDYLLNHLPDYMIPSNFVQMDKIPLTPSGKVDRGALPGPEAKKSGNYVAPRNEIEKKLVKVWSEILGKEPLLVSQLQTSIGIDDNFFHLGGNSLKATVLASRIHKESNIRLPLAELFKKPTIRGLSEYIREAAKDIYESIMPVEEREYYVLSFSQQRVYILQQLQLNSTAYNMPQIMSLSGDIDIDRLGESFRKLLKRHDSLRTSFHMVGDQPVQKVHQEVAFEIEDIHFVRPFDLSKAPLMRVSLLKNSDGSFLLFVDMHHIISDGISHQVLQEDFMALYEGKELPPLRLQYKDFSHWQNSERKKENLQRQEEYWLKEFTGELPVLDLPNDYPRPLMQSFEGSSINFEISVAETGHLNAVALKGGYTLFMVLTAVFNIFLSKLGGQEEIIMGTPIAGRRHADLEKIIGMFVNTLALRNYPAGERMFKEFLDDVKERLLMVFENQEYPFEELVDKLSVKRDSGRNPLFDILFVFQNMNKSSASPGKKTGFENGRLIQTVKFDLTLTAVERSQGLFLSFQYCTKLFKKETIDRFIIYFKKIAALVVKDPDIRLSKIEIIPEEEKERILNDFNRAEAVYPNDKTIPQLFEEQVERTPDHIITVGALLCEHSISDHYHTRVTYLTLRELNNRSNRTANRLRAKGLKHGAIVGIMVEPIPEMVVGILGILKAGCVFLPLEPKSPMDRINFSLSDSNTNIILSQTHLAKNFKKNIEIMNLEDSRLCTGESQNFISAGSADPLYVIYTSGTTGRPKGVLIAHKNMVNYVYWFVQTIRLTAADRAILTSSFAFDALYTQLFSSLLTGCQLHIIPRETFLFSERLLNYLRKNKITYIKVTPSLFNLIVNSPGFSSKTLNVLRLVMMGGEEINANDVEKAHALCPHLHMMNHYGPTETTIGSIARFLDFDKFEEFKMAPTIGKPLNNTRAYIMDKEFNVVPIGVVGGLYIGGDGVGMGYLNKPELTAEKFIDFHHSSFIIHHSILYHTGDLARWHADGNIEFLGRADDQVKIRGYRIELGEIERPLANFPGIKEVVLSVRQEKGGGKYICAYITSKDDISFSELRKYLSAHLPDYMIPSYFVNLEKIPLTVHGKVNLNALPEPRENILRDNTEYIAPQNAVEKKLVEIWEKVLGRTAIGINENFFQVGGDSIKSLQIISRMNSAGYKIEMRDLFQYPVISELAPHVKKLKHIPNQTIITGTIPLTPIQEIFFDRSYKDPHHYNQSVMFYSRDRLNKKEIEAVFTKIQEHHDTLRMTYEINKENGEVSQIDHGFDYPLTLEEYEINGPAADLETIAERMQASIDLEKGPMMKLGLFHLKDGDRLLIVIHHLVIDGVSWRILFEDIETLYGQYRRDEKLVLPPKTDSFKNWSEKLSAYANSKSFLKEKNYWQKIEAVEVPLIHKDYEVADNYIKDNGSVSFSLKKEETERLLTKVNKVLGTEINDILLTALGMSIKKTLGQNTILIALEGHGREEILEGIDISRTVGWFTGLYPVVMDISYSDHPIRQIKEVKETLRRIPNKGIGYGILKYLTHDENKKEIEFKLEPQVSFNYLGQFDWEVKQILSFEIAKESAGNSRSLNNRRKYLLDVSGIVTNNRLTMTISFNKTHFKPGTIAALVDNLETQLKRIIEFCCCREKIERTPSDFTYNGLSIESVDRLMELFPNAEDLYTLTPMQEGMLFHASVDDGSYSYFQQVSYRMLGELDICLVEKSLNELIKRHDILRTAFVCKDIERPVQLVLKNKVIDFYYEDISKIDAREGKEAFIKQYREKDKERSFDLRIGASMRAAIFRLEEAEYEFTWSHHHILMDGWCTGILNTEFFEIYASYLENRPYRLPGVKPYRTYIRWLEKQDKEESARYWEKYLESYEEQTGIPIPWTKISKAGNRYRNETVSIVFDMKKTAALNRLAAGNHVTLNTVTQTLWGILLGKYNGKEDVVFGAVVSGRPFELEGVESMIGLFINTIPVRIRFAENMKFYRLLQQVQQEALAGEPYHYHPLAEIQSRAVLRQNLIDHILVYENYPIVEQIEGYAEGKNKSKTSLKLANVEVFEQTNYDFNVIVSGSEQLKISFKYNGNVYDEDFVERVAGCFALTFDQVIENRELEVRELTLLSEEEKNRILYEFNDTGTEYPKDQAIHQLFAGQVERTPDRVALVGTDLRFCPSFPVQPVQPVPTVRPVSLTYRQLNEQSNRLAGWLIEKGVLPDHIVGIMMGRSVEMIIGIMGILKSGGAYMPIDPDSPEERINYMLKDSNAGILMIINDPNKNRNFGIPFVLNLEHLDFDIVSDFEFRISNFNSSNLAYLIYTSGSTGKPKGVMVEHRSLVNLCCWHNTFYAITPWDRATKYAGFGFDASVWEIFPYLVTGASLYIVPEEIILDIEGLNRYYENNGVTVSFLPTQMAEQFMTINNTSLRVLLTGGDKLKNYIKKNYRLYNNYGPTENTVVATSYWVTEESVNIPIGKPVSNNRIYIIDRNHHLQPIGVPGELCVGGESLARGYLNNPELTAKKFISFAHFHHSSLSIPHSILYRTGDLARRLPDGNIEFYGRIDRQVKIRGFRIELGEIEGLLLKHELVKETVVVDCQDTAEGEKYLCAYIVPHLDSMPDAAELKNYLSRNLPDYMVPTFFITIGKIPLNPNGKIDKKALPTPPVQRAAFQSSTYEPPRDYIERTLIEVWSDVLNIKNINIGIDDNFFDLGGHSLNAAALTARIHKIFNVTVPLKEFFQRGCIREITKYIKKAANEEFTTLEPVEKKEYYPLSTAQKRLYVLQQIDKEGTAYNISRVIPLKVEQELDKNLLEKVFIKLIQRHESLRTSFITVNEETVQKIHDAVPFEIAYKDLAAGGTGAFDLSKAPLLRASLVKENSSKYILIVDMHHIISDGFSHVTLEKEFLSLLAGKELPSVKFQYKDYVHWQH
ncbi:MAG TPA: amino acid adenylation domain-containing protein, partial [Candidatus Deferrimicrobium sp.]|nr:amino acid adenylation domain-containing protein [Candidatus Deferrimicrobium sp.]